MKISERKLNPSGAIKYDEFDFKMLDEADFISRIKWKQREHYYEPIITADTETAKYNNEILFVTDWSITIEGIAVVYGHHVRDMIEFIQNMMKYLGCDSHHRIVVYMHNFSYDYMFMRNHLFEYFGYPIQYLAVKTHKYVNMIFTGLEFRDSYILTQRSLEKFCIDMGTYNRKQVGAWDYNKFRTPGSPRTQDEMEYMLLDTIALNEALRVFMNQHECDVRNCELTNTGFVRKAGMKAKRNGDKEWYKKFQEMRLDVEQYKMLEECYHGGYTHANRYHIGETLHDVVSYDFASSYPAVLCYEKYPMGAFKDINCTVDDILDLQEEYAFFRISVYHKYTCSPKQPNASNCISQIENMLERLFM